MEHDEIRQVSEELEELLGTLPPTPESMEPRSELAASESIEPRVELAASESMEPKLEAVEPESSEPEVLHSHLKSNKSQLYKPHEKRKPAPQKDYIRPTDGLLAAFFVPIVIMVIIFSQRGIFPFGEESFLRTDMYHQYAPFFSEFQDKLTHGGSLLYSWNIGMGVNFSALYAYYLASPLNWLLILCPKNLIIEFMTYSIVLKIGLSGLTFAYYLRKHCRTSDFGIAFFGIFYALSGYMAAYSWNIMWLDCILLFPLIVLGLEQLVKEKKCFLYCICLGLSILSNYYISIMICIFMVLYFIALLILEDRKPLRAYLRNVTDFTLYSLLAGGLSAVVLLPEIFALQATASGDFNFPQTVTSYFSIFDLIARHIGNIDIEIGLDHWPNLYCGVAVLLFFLLYLVCKKIPIKEKVVFCGLLLLFFASFSVNTLNFIWHGFHYPNSLPCRQSFIYIFLMLLICYRAYMYLQDTSWKQISKAFLLAIAFVILAEKLVEQEHFRFYVYYIAILMLSLYAGLLYFYQKGTVSRGRLVILALAVVSIEAAVNTTITSVTTTGRSAYMNDNLAVKKLTDSLQPASTFYRIEKVTRKTKNDGAWMNFPSVSLFSSTANAELTAFFKSIGCEGNTNAYSITGSTPWVDSLFSVRYGLYSSEQKNELLTLLGQEEETYLYEKAYTLPVGFLVASDMEENWQRDQGNPIMVQNDFCNVIGADPVLEDAGGDTTGDTFRFTPELDGDYYAYVSNRKIEEVTVTKGENTQTFQNIDRGFLLELGECTAGEEVILKSDKKEQNMTVKVYRFSNAGLKSVYDQLNQYPLAVTSWTDSSLEGVIGADQAGTLFTSIPYDKGWTVKVDGLVQESQKIFGAFLSVNLTEGSHTVSFEYEPEGLRLGAYISGGCVVFLLAIAGIQQWLKRRNEEEEEAEVSKRLKE
ncbi:MAG: YfhO family protein [Hungatella sp.]